MRTAASATLARMPRASPAALATALAHAFLGADEWSKESLTAAAAYVLGARRRWVPGVVAHVLGSYRRAPVDAPRELAAVVGQSEAFGAALDKAAQQRKPIRLAHYALEPGRARDGSRAVPRIDTLAGLAAMLGITAGELEWFADTRQWNRTAGSKGLQHYRYLWRARPGRVPRLLEIPAPRLRAIQRTVLESMLAPIPLHDAAHGFVRGRSAATGAALHTGSEVVINLDLSTFFAKVPPGRVFGALRQAGYPESVAHRITGLCTHAVPAPILSLMPPGGSPEERFALRRALAAPHLPQGAPTSPMLANLSLRRLDARLSGWAAAAGGVYTRYADDLAFSGGTELARRADAFVRGAGRIIGDEGHAVNRSKTRIRGTSVRQMVTGVVVNERTNVRRDEYDQLKAILHNCVLHGAHGQNRDGHLDFRAHLLGRICWIESLNPDRGARLRRDFARIQWIAAP